MADQRDDFEGQTEETEGTGDGEQGDEGTSGAAEGTGEQQDNSGDTDDALRKMQSERDKETARANKAEKQLKALQRQDTSASGEGTQTQVPEEVSVWITAAQQNTRDALYKANPDFEAFGVDPNLITGETPAAMQASAKALGEFVDKTKRSVRDSVLQEHGFTPAPRDAASTGKKNFKTMDQKEFDAIVEDALRG